MTDAIPEFGTKLPGISYRLRPGAYLVIRNDAGELAIVKEDAGWFLPGGGIDTGETPESAAVREALEECAFQVVIQELVGVADEFVYSAAESAYLHKQCTFFTARVVGRDDARAGDLPLVWMDPQRALRELVHGSQRWAVARACDS